MKVEDHKVSEAYRRTIRTGKEGDIFMEDWQPVSDRPTVDL